MEVDNNIKIPEYKIEAVHYGDDGWIERVKLDNGEDIPVSAAMILIESGVIEGYKINQRHGRRFIQGEIDQDWENNLQRLPKY